MKKVLTVLFAIATLSANAQTEKKDTVIYTIKFTQVKFQKLYNILRFSKQALPTSKAPAVDVTDAISAIEEIQKEMEVLYNENKKFK